MVNNKKSYYGYIPSTCDWLIFSPDSSSEYDISADGKTIYIENSDIDFKIGDNIILSASTNDQTVERSCIISFKQIECGATAQFTVTQNKKSIIETKKITSFSIEPTTFNVPYTGGTYTISASAILKTYQNGVEISSEEITNLSNYGDLECVESSTDISLSLNNNIATFIVPSNSETTSKNYTVTESYTVKSPYYDDDKILFTQIANILQAGMGRYTFTINSNIANINYLFADSNGSALQETTASTYTWAGASESEPSVYGKVDYTLNNAAYSLSITDSDNNPCSEWNIGSEPTKTVNIKSIKTSESFVNESSAVIDNSLTKIEPNGSITVNLATSQTNAEFSSEKVFDSTLLSNAITVTNDLAANTSLLTYNKEQSYSFYISRNGTQVTSLEEELTLFDVNSSRTICIVSTNSNGENIPYTISISEPWIELSSLSENSTLFANNLIFKSDSIISSSSTVTFKQAETNATLTYKVNSIVTSTAYYIEIRAYFADKPIIKMPSTVELYIISGYTHQINNDPLQYTTSFTKCTSFTYSSSLDYIDLLLTASYDVNSQQISASNLKINDKNGAITVDKINIGTDIYIFYKNSDNQLIKFTRVNITPQFTNCNYNEPILALFDEYQYYDFNNYYFFQY